MPTPLLPNPGDPGSLSQRNQVQAIFGSATLYNPITVGNAYIAAVAANGAELRVATSSPFFGSGSFPVISFATGNSLETQPGIAGASASGTGGNTREALFLLSPTTSGKSQGSLQLWGGTSDGTSLLATSILDASDIQFGTGPYLRLLSNGAPVAGDPFSGPNFHVVTSDTGIIGNVPNLIGFVSGNVQTTQFSMQAGTSVVTLAGPGALHANITMPTAFHTSTDAVLVTNGNPATNAVIPGVATAPSASVFTVVDIAATGAAATAQINWIAWGH